MRTISLSRRQFHERARQGNLIPVFRQLLGDVHTPISIFLKFNGDRRPNSFLLESVINGERLGRHSFIGVEARAILRGRDGRFELHRRDGDAGDAYTRTESYDGEPLEFIRNQFRNLNPVPDARLPAFYGGAVGFLAYDVIRYYEKLPDENPDTADQEDAYFILADELAVVDHIERHIQLIVNIRTDDFKDPDAAYDFALRRLDAMEAGLHNQGGEEREIKRIKGKMPIASNMSATEYKDMVVRARDYIYAGDIFQVVLSKRYSFRPEVDNFQVYRALRSINPSPYMYFLNLGPYTIVGSSPEILVQCQQDRVVVRPIAGTRPRGRTPEADLELERDLLADTKEIAEHIMLVDLGRNDLGRVCEPGTVRVTDFKTIERYSHV
ncbi:MAG: chorismate-binding protein, partial [Leptospiraceae bacterium]|nr:chorismate-binding protein [Leptospiraceae bacterium]